MTVFDSAIIDCKYITFYFIMHAAFFTTHMSNMLFCVEYFINVCKRS